MSELIVTINPASVSDINSLRQLSIDTFVDTYNAYNTPENMQLYIETYFNPQRIGDEINNSNIQYYLAAVGNALVGYIKMRTEETPPELAGVRRIEIERIYVSPNYKGLKIGKQLIAHALTVARQQQFEVLWLGVWEKNENAIAFYKKQGFTIFGEHDFILGTDAQRDWLMKIDVEV
jgi:ribosomal protein S18 acetylase RimI-like enzyme